MKRVQMITKDNTIISMKCSSWSRALEIAQARPNVVAYRFVTSPYSGFIHKSKFTSVRR